MESKSDTYIIILAAGYGTRLKPLSNRIPKPLLDINGKTIISRIISNFKNSGFSRFCVLVGYKKELIKEEVLKIKEIEIKFVEQKQVLGMADAIALCVNYINKSEEYISHFFVSAADIVISQNKILDMYLLHLKTESDMVLSLMISNDIEIAKGHGNVKISDVQSKKGDKDYQGFKILDIIEKPEPNQILSEYYSLPLYLFNQIIVKYLEKVRISERGEKEFQDAIKEALKSGANVLGLKIIDELVNIDSIGRYHITYLRDLIQMNNKFISGVSLKKFKGNSPEFFEPVKISYGVEMGYRVSLGPYVSIGNYCKIGDFCELADVIVFDNTTLGKSSRLNWCIIDENVILPDNFYAHDCFITLKDENKLELEIIYF